MADCEQCAALQRQNDFLANDRDGYVQVLTDENNKLRAEVERLKADIAYADKHAAKVEDLLWGTAKENEKLKALAVKSDEAIARQQQDLEEAADRAADCGILRAEVDTAAGMLREAKARNADFNARVVELEGALERIDRIDVYDEDARETLRAKLGVMRDIARAALTKGEREG